MSFVNSFSKHFQSYRHDVSEKARQYASGLMQAGSCKNMDRIAEVVPNSKSRNLQQFITHSKWNAQDVIDQVAHEANELLGHEDDACLLIDETGFKKQGKMSVGTARQWLGRLGKVDNGQVAVFAALANGNYTIAIDERLYLPKSWTNDPERCDKAAVPKTHQKFRTKDELAVEMVRNALTKGIKFRWVGADAGYGKGLGFCKAIEAMGKCFVVDVHSDYRVYLEDPQPYIPEKKSKVGPKFKRLRSDAEPIEVVELVKQWELEKQPVLELRETTRGPLKVRAFSQPVYVWDGKSESATEWVLLATQSVSSNPETKISISNACESTDLQRLAWMQRQRYWVERGFEDAKSECGMADYQVRKWSAWHHHMALVMMAMLFMLTERMRHADTCPLLTCADIEELLSHFLPRRDTTEEEVLRQLETRHRYRQAAINSHARRSRVLSSPGKN